MATSVLLGFPCGSAGKESTCNVGDLCLIPGLGSSPGEWKGYPLQYSDLENVHVLSMFGQGGLACCDSWSCKELDTTERLN